MEMNNNNLIYLFIYLFIRRGLGRLIKFLKFTLFYPKKPSGRLLIFFDLRRTKIEVYLVRQTTRETTTADDYGFLTSRL